MFVFDRTEFTSSIFIKTYNIVKILNLFWYFIAGGFLKLGYLSPGGESKAPGGMQKVHGVQFKA